jgi:meiotically up-regulated gene 157 (Mug157) protein
LLTLFLAASAAAEDKPCGDNTAAGFAHLSRSKAIATQFLAAAAIYGSVTDMPPLSADKQIPELEHTITEVSRAAAAFLNDPERQQLISMFRLALTDTVRQLVMGEDGTAYVKTGDIPAQWLRDSSAQVRPLLYFARENRAIADMVKAVIERQARYIALDPYANAFRDDFTIWERKFELDSLSFPILLVWTYWKITGDNSVFTPSLKTAFRRALETMLTEQDHHGVRPGHQPSGYHFKSDTQSSGKMPVGYTGMSGSPFVHRTMNAFITFRSLWKSKPFKR